MVSNTTTTRERGNDGVFKLPMFLNAVWTPYFRFDAVSSDPHCFRINPVSKPMLHSRVNAAFLHQRRVPMSMVSVSMPCFRFDTASPSWRRVCFNAVFSNQRCLLPSEPNAFNPLPILPPSLPLQPPLSSQPPSSRASSTVHSYWASADRFKKVESWNGWSRNHNR